MKYLTVLIVIAISGCSVPAAVVGRFFDDNAVRKLPEGTSRVSVLKQFGTPQVTELLLDEEGTETWVYSYTITKTVKTPDGLIAQDVTTKSAVLQFKNGKLTRKDFESSPSAYAGSQARFHGGRLSPDELESVTAYLHSVSGE